MFGKDVEEIKQQAHEYLFTNGYDGTSTKRVKLLKQFKQDKVIIGRLDIQRLERLQQLQQLEQLQQLQRLEISSLDYRDIVIKPNSIIYCDPPYENTNHYNINFDHREFWHWVRASKNPVYVSEYKAPKDIKCIAEFEHRSTLSSTSNNLVIEKIFWNGV